MTRIVLKVYHLPFLFGQKLSIRILKHSYHINNKKGEMNMNNYTIYMHKNKINGKVYIGQTCQNPIKR